MIHQGVAISDAKKLPQSFFDKLEEWRRMAQELLDSGRIKWYSKYVITEFTYNDIHYSVTARDVFAPEVYKLYEEKCCLNMLDAVLEGVQMNISDDLKALGAEDVWNYGLLD